MAEEENSCTMVNGCQKADFRLVPSMLSFVTVPVGKNVGWLERSGSGDAAVALIPSKCR